jgi:hypothetical protein
MTMAYSIKLTEAQMRVISDALELYMRIRLGQIETVVDPWMFAKRGDGRPQTAELLHEARRQLESVKEVLTGFSPTASWGIRAEEVPDVARVASDLRDVIRHHLAWERSPEGGGSVDFYKPMHWGSEPLPVVEGTSVSLSEGAAIVVVRELAAADYDKHVAAGLPSPTGEQLKAFFYLLCKESFSMQRATATLGDPRARKVYFVAWGSLERLSSRLRLHNGRLEQAGNYPNIPWADVTRR